MGTSFTDQLKDTTSDIASLGQGGSGTGQGVRGAISEAERKKKALEAPQQDAARDLIRRNIIIARIRRATFAGAGRSATVATSPRGLTGVTTTTKRTLQGT